MWSLRMQLLPWLELWLLYHQQIHQYNYSEVEGDFRIPNGAPVIQKQQPVRFWCKSWRWEGDSFIPSFPSISDLPLLHHAVLRFCQDFPVSRKWLVLLWPHLRLQSLWSNMCNSVDFSLTATSGCTASAFLWITASTSHTVKTDKAGELQCPKLSKD